jgi:hypothetical protein
LIKILFYPTSKRHLLISFGFHVLLGFISIFNTIPLVLWFYLVLFSQLKTVFSNTSRKNKLITLLSLLVYLAPFEMLCRMANTSPLIPFELGKYLTFILVIIGIQINRSSKGIGYWIVFLTIPGILMGWAGAPDYRYIIFNILGIINLGLGIVFFSGFFRESKSLDIDSIIRLISYPLLSALIFAFFKTPNYDEIDFQLGANFDASGGFGSNQVSTAFGLGMFLIFYLWLKGVSFTGSSKLFDLGLIGLFFFQGLLTFSRGGIIGGVLGMILLLYSVLRQRNSKFFLNRISRLFFLGIPIIVILAVSANELTGGKLLLRYQGETAGTLAGAKEKSANTLTSGRYEIFVGDLEIFNDNPIFGVGVNESRYIRRFSPGVVAHVELSRLLAEHGILGFFIFFIFIYYLLVKFQLMNSEFAILYILFVIGFYTTFHAATRTFLSPLLMSIAYLPNYSIKTKKLE